jgi:serine/threonine-protein kinase
MVGDLTFFSFVRMAKLNPLIENDRLLGGKYRLGPIIGSGGVATVYRATHIWTEREVAVKLLDPTLPHFDRLREGFLREARATVQLDHPNVVDVLDMGEDDWDTVYMVMELLEGPTLRDLLLEHGQLELRDTLSILLPLIDALEKAHEIGIVHRDFKPENIMLSPDPYGVGTPKLLDFGVAEILQDARWGTGGNRSEVIMGTPQYMAPEQARDQRAHIGPHTDVWGVAVVWYECLTGHSLFDGDSAMDILESVCDAEMDFDAVPPEAAPVLRDALRRSPEERIGALSILKARIEEMGFTKASTPPPSAALSSWPAARTNTGVAQPTLTGLGPQELLLPAPSKTHVDTEDVHVPLRSHRRVALAGLGLTLAVALAAWWTVRVPQQARPNERWAPLVEAKVLPVRAEPAILPTPPPDVPELSEAPQAPPEAPPEEPKAEGSSDTEVPPPLGEQEPKAEALVEAPPSGKPVVRAPSKTSQRTTRKSSDSNSGVRSPTPPPPSGSTRKRPPDLVTEW